MYPLWIMTDMTLGYNDNTFYYNFNFLTNTKHLYNIYTMLGQRRRRWADVV